MLKKVSIKVKLTLITAVSSILSLLVAAAGFLYYDGSSFKTQMQSNLLSQAEVVAANCSTALSGNRKADAEKALATLRYQNDVQGAALYGNDGKLFASYTREGVSPSILPKSSTPDGAFFEGDTLQVSRAIRSPSGEAGSLFIQSGMQEWYQRRHDFSTMVVCLVLLCAALALIIGAGMQKMISTPILHLAQTMREIAAKQLFDTRVQKRGEDEIGELVDGFNSMLSEIEIREDKLHRANHELEERVKRRTQRIEQEVAEREAAQQELLRSQKDLEDFFENAAIGLHLLGPEGKVLRANTAELNMLGYKADEYVGRNFADFHVDKEAARKYLTSLTAGESVSGFEATMICKGGQLKDVGIESNVLLDGDKFIHARCFVRDLTAQREAEKAQRAKEQAERANFAKSEFLSRMSHELRTPMNSILGFSQLLQMEELNEDMRDSVDQIVVAGSHLLRLINEVLDISRIEMGSISVSNEPVGLGDAVQEAVSLVQPLANQRSIVISIDPSITDAYVTADRQRIAQILLNLLSNAIKYNNEGGAVEVKAVPVDSRLRITISDTGPGVPDEKLPLIFTPFERLGAEQTTIEGTGLGLALSRRLAEAMGGDLGILPQAVGACFYLELATAESPLRLVANDEADECYIGHLKDTSIHTVLLVEDNIANVRLVEKIFSSKPEFRLIVALKGTLALELAREHQPDLILLDLNLPDIDGDVVLEKLREQSSTASIPVAIVSADATPAQMERLLAAGAMDYLTKPLNVKAFLSLLDRVCAPKVKSA